MTLFQKLHWLRRFGSTARFHGNGHRWVGPPQTVFQHSAGTALLLIELYPDCSAALLKAAILHDLEEGVTGDVPAPVKWETKAIVERLEARVRRFFDIRFPELTEEEHRRLKVADTLDAVLTLLEQRAMGNNYADWAFVNYTSFIRSSPLFHHGVYPPKTPEGVLWEEIHLAYVNLRSGKPLDTDGAAALNFWNSPSDLNL